MLISGVVTQGARHTPDFVTQYRVGYSIDGQRWNIYKENGTDKVIIVLFTPINMVQSPVCNVQTCSIEKY